jgi:hypothetical protein
MFGRSPEETSQDIRQLQAKRFQFLRYLYERSRMLQDGELQEVAGPDIQGAVGISAAERSQIEDYLAKRGLIEIVSVGPTLAITVAGIDYIEAALTEPDRPTRYFPPASTLILNVTGGIHGSQISQGSIGSSQHMTVGTSADVIVTLLALVSDIRAELRARSMAADQRQEAEADLATIELQARSPKPKWSVIRETLSSTRSVAEGVVGSMLATKILEMLTHLPH